MTTQQSPAAKLDTAWNGTAAACHQLWLVTSSLLSSPATSTVTGRSRQHASTREIGATSPDVCGAPAIFVVYLAPCQHCMLTVCTKALRK